MQIRVFLHPLYLAALACTSSLFGCVASVTDASCLVGDCSGDVAAKADGDDSTDGNACALPDDYDLDDRAAICARASTDYHKSDSFYYEDETVKCYTFGVTDRVGENMEIEATVALLDPPPESARLGVSLYWGLANCQNDERLPTRIWGDRWERILHFRESDYGSWGDDGGQFYLCVTGYDLVPVCKAPYPETVSHYQVDVRGTGIWTPNGEAE